MTTPGRNDREVELAALAAQLRAPPPTPAEPPPAAPRHAAPPPDIEEIQQALERLQSLAADGVAELDEAVAGHPWASVAAAFLLGLCVGRLLPRA